MTRFHLYKVSDVQINDRTEASELVGTFVSSAGYAREILTDANRRHGDRYRIFVGTRDPIKVRMR